MSIFSEATHIPVSLILTVGGSFVTFVVWLAKLQFNVRSLEKKLDEKDITIKGLREEVQRELKTNKTDSERLVRLETQVTAIMKQLEKLELYLRDNIEKH